MTLTIKPICLNSNMFSGCSNIKSCSFGADDKVYAKKLDNPQDCADKAKKDMEQGDWDSAISNFEKAIESKPDSADLYYDLGKTYKFKGNLDKAIVNLEKYNSMDDKNPEAIVLLGQTYKENGQYALAKSWLQKALSINDKDDFASRNLKETQNYLDACYDPRKAYQDKKKQSEQVLSEALTLAQNYLPSGFMKGVKDVSITFDKTAKMGGHSNIAQYEHKNRRIVVTDEYIYAGAPLVGSYLVHEFVHAKDNDPYTSVREEQDAYKIATEFWIKNSGQIADPEMDYAADLFKKSPETLNTRVGEIYRLRDGSIPEISPNHPPGNKKVAAVGLNSGSTPIKAYDVIA